MWLKGNIEELGDKPLNDLLDQFGGWPLTSKIKKDLEWIDTYLKLRQLGHSSSFFFSIAVDPDMKDNSQQIIIVRKEDQF